MFFGSFSHQVAISGDGMVTGKYGIFILSCSEEDNDGYASSLRKAMVRVDDKSMSRMREMLF